LVAAFGVASAIVDLEAPAFDEVSQIPHNPGGW
jgi:hypothetical protein